MISVGKMKAKIIFFLISLFIVGGIFFLVKNNVGEKESEPKTISEEEKQCEEAIETREQCLENARNLNDERLIGEVLRIGNKNIYHSELDVPLFLYIRELVKKHFVCELQENKSKEILEEAKRFTKNLPTGSLEHAKDTRDVLEKWYDNICSGSFSSEFITLSQVIALEDLEKVCPEELSKMCTLKFGKESEYCFNLCNNLDQYDNNNNVEASMGGLLVPEELSLRQRVAITYRFSGEKEALKICDSLKEKEECTNFVKLITVNDSISCENIDRLLSEALCYDALNK